MGSSRMSLKRSLLLSTFAALSLFSTAALAQGNGNGNNPPPPPAKTDDPGPTGLPPLSGDSSKTTPPSSKPTDGKPTDGKSSDSKSTPSASQPKLPGISTPSPTPTGKPPPLPTLPSTADRSIPTYPPPSPPPVQNAPFMNRSTLPDGTVFIAVGAILGLFGLGILLWRGIVAFLLKRSVEKAAMAQHTTHDKVAASFPPPPDTFYKYTDDSSATLSAAALVGSGRGQRRTTRGPIPSQTPSTTNLFFSPTAAANAPGSAMNNSSRNSSFLPAGFYAATSASPAASGHGHGQSISLSNLNPASNRASHVPLRHSPPESPELAPRTTPPHHSNIGRNNFSTSSISLNRPPSGRAPSAFLDDILDDQPGAFPPAAPQGSGNPPGHYRGFSGQQQPRF